MSVPSDGRPQQPPLPAQVKALGLVSLFMDVASEMIHSLLPLFLVTVLGVGTLAVGFIEGLAEGVALVGKALSGLWSDRMGRRKPLALAGYGLGALSKPLFALAPGAGLVLAARVLDRIGKGLRGAPRDALVADLCPPAQRDAAYGLRQALDSVGALLGPLLAMLLMLATGSFRLVFAVAILPGLIAVGILHFAVKEPAPQPVADRPRRAFWKELRGLLALRAGLGESFNRVLVLGLLLQLARFSEAFLLLKAGDTGLPLAVIPAVMVLMNAVYAGSSWQACRLVPRLGRRRLLALALALLVLADLTLARAAGPALLAAGVALWGLHMGLSQGLLAAMVADSAPPERRGTAFGLFHLAGGGATLAASLLAGGLWQAFGVAATFLAGAGLALAALTALLLLRTDKRPAH